MPLVCASQPPKFALFNVVVDSTAESITVGEQVKIKVETVTIVTVREKWNQTTFKQIQMFKYLWVRTMEYKAIT